MQRPSDPRTRSPARASGYVEQKFEQPVKRWLDALSVAVGKVHFTAHVAMVIGYRTTSGTSGD
jgi:hypothetical protein